MTLYTKRSIIQSQARGSRVAKEGGQNKRKEVARMDEEQKKEQEINELLEVLEKALRSEAVERITIQIKPNQKSKQSKK